MSFQKRSGSEAKFGNSGTTQDGYSFGSKLEAAVYQILKLRAAAGEIAILQIQDHLTICGDEDHACEGAITYIADFKCQNIKSGEMFWVEAKGFANDRWPMKLRLYKHYGPGPLEIWKGSYSRPQLDKVIIPRRRSA